MQLMAFFAFRFEFLFVTPSSAHCLATPSKSAPIMYSKTALLMLTGLASSASAFQPAAMSRASAIAASRQFTSSTAALGSEATKAAVEGLYKEGGAHAEQKFDADFDVMVKAAFPGAMSNQELETKVVGILSAKGYSA